MKSEDYRKEVNLLQAECDRLREKFVTTFESEIGGFFAGLAREVGIEQKAKSASLSEDKISKIKTEIASEAAKQKPHVRRLFGESVWPGTSASSRRVIKYAKVEDLLGTKEITDNFYQSLVELTEPVGQVLSNNGFQMGNQGLISQPRNTANIRAGQAVKYPILVRKLRLNEGLEIIYKEYSNTLASKYAASKKLQEALDAEQDRDARDKWS